MEKLRKESSSLRKKPMKTSKKKHEHRLLKKVVDYLKSDSYLYAPLLSSRPFSKHITPLAPGKGTETELLTAWYGEKEKEKRLIEKVVDYLMCDCYMYAPLLNDTQQPQKSDGVFSPPTNQTTTDVPKKKKSSPQKVSTVERTRPATPTKEREREWERGSKAREDKANASVSVSVSPPARIPLVKKTVAYSETVKQTVRKRCGSLAVPGALHETEPRELLVD